MIREIIHDPIFLQQKSREATPEDLPVAADLQDTLCACIWTAAQVWLQI